jgi:hypothetical protein
LLLVLISTVEVLAQSNLNGAYNLMVRKADIEQLNEFEILSEEELAGIQGSPYENKTFIMGNVYQNDKLVLKNVPLRYNSYADEIEMKQNAADTNYNALLKNPEFFVKMFNNVYIFVPKNNSNEEGGYFKIITSGKHYDLFKKSITTYLGPREAKTSYEVAQPGKFVTKDTFFLMSKDGKLGELPTNRNKISKVLTSRTKEVKKYIIANRLDLEKDADMAKLIEYYNSIL